MAITLKVTDKRKWGQTNILPYIGETTFSTEDGTFEVSDEEIATKLIGTGLGFETVGKATTKVVKAEEPKAPEVPAQEPLQPQVEKEGDIGQSDDDKHQPLEPGTTEEDELTTMINSLPDMKVEDLKKLCETYPKEEWKKFTKKTDYVEYITGKLKA